MAGRFEIAAVVKMVDQFTRPMAQIQSRMTKFARGVNGAMDRTRNATNQMARSAATTGLVLGAAAAPAIAATTDIIDTGAQFELSLATAAAKFKDGVEKGTEAYAAATKAAQDLALVTEFTSQQSADALGFLAVAGFNSAAAIASLEPAANLATASGLDLARVTDIASDVMGILGLSFDTPIEAMTNFTRVSDLMIKATTSANLDTEMLFETLREGGKAAKEFGSSMETTVTLISKLADQGIKGSKAGTSLKNLFAKLAKPSTKAIALMDQFNIKTAEMINGRREARNMIDILHDMGTATKHLGSADRLAMFAEIFGTEALPSALALMSVPREVMVKMRSELEASSGTTARIAQKMRATTMGWMKSLGSAIESVKLAIFSMNEDGLRETFEVMTLWVRANKDLIASKFGEWLGYIVDNFQSIVTGATRIVAFIVVFAGFVAVVNAISVAVTAWTGAMIALNFVLGLNPVVLIVAGVLALVVAIGVLVKYLYENWDFVMESLVHGWQAIKDAIWSFAKWIADSAIMALTDPFGFLLAYYTNLWNGITSIFKAGWNAIAGIVDKVSGALSYVVGAGKTAASIVSDPTGLFNERGETTREQVDRERTETLGEGGVGPIMSPSQRIIETIKNSKQTSELILRNESSATVAPVGGRMPPGLQVVQTGGA